MSNKFKGKLLAIDAFGVENKKLTNKKYLASMLEEIPRKLGMHILKKPAIEEIKSDRYPNTGLSGFVILYESHVSFHTWPEENYIAVDIFSCNDFKEKTAVKCFKELLNPKKLKSKSIIRG
ncbi:adenosylmethionine decarboxylase [Candidatus Azambacteria bacterium]|nr:adenosylmethionine decarboxylase [Candidatus Azambacteria bacterium]